MSAKFALWPSATKQRKQEFGERPRYGGDTHSTKEALATRTSTDWNPFGANFPLPVKAERSNAKKMGLLNFLQATTAERLGKRSLPQCWMAQAQKASGSRRPRLARACLYTKTRIQMLLFWSHQPGKEEAVLFSPEFPNSLRCDFTRMVSHQRLQVPSRPNLMSSRHVGLQSTSSSASFAA